MEGAKEKEPGQASTNTGLRRAYASYLSGTSMAYWRSFPLCLSRRWRRTRVLAFGQPPPTNEEEPVAQFGCAHSGPSLVLRDIYHNFTADLKFGQFPDVVVCASGFGVVVVIGGAAFRGWSSRISLQGGSQLARVRTPSEMVRSVFFLGATGYFGGAWELALRPYGKKLMNNFVTGSMHFAPSIDAPN
ncbi:hypothetical protein EI94DRAFT_1699127 [Lactarius quietus]|nr:hypothetical protein EI94DRAFT_1699127 [Lactarius quietus]